MAFRHVAKQGRKSSENVQNLEFSSASVMFKVTFKYDSLISGNDEHRFIRLFDVLNHVVWSIFCRGCRMHRISRASEMLRNVLESRGHLTGIARICTAINPRES